MTALPFRRHAVAAAVCLLALPFAAQALPERAPVAAADALSRLTANAGGALKRSALPESSYNLVAAARGAVLSADGGTGQPVLRAQNFLSLYGGVAGVTDAVRQLTTVRTVQEKSGDSHVHMDQMQNGLPVFGARLVVHMNGQGITGVNGVFVPGLESLDTTPKQSVAALRERALAAARKLHPKQPLVVESSRLMIYNTGLLQGLTGSNRLAYEVMLRGSNPARPVRERIILDANSAAILNRIDEIHSVLNRSIHTPNLDTPAVLTEATPVPLRPTDPPLILDRARAATISPNLPQNNLFIFAGGTWALYKNLFGADGYDFTRPPAGGQVQRSVYLVNEQCPNAYWDGVSTNYCPAFDADDIVSHEWSHAYTEYTSGLVYQYQSGALNESYSDIFGETYDLVNGIDGPLSASLTEGATYDNRGSRWVVGEDLSEVAAILLLRDMWDPDTFPTPSPGSTFTSENYYCETGDNGGVHTNSGVPNHAYAMLVDGKTFNGVTIPAIGMTKAAQIYFRAQSVYQTPTTNFAQHADALEQSCQDLKGKPLNNVLGAVSNEVIGDADCAAVAKAIQAVEFRTSVKVKCNYQPVLKPEATTPALCASGKSTRNFFAESFEGATALPTGWTQGANVTGDLPLPPWTVSAEQPAPHAGTSAFFPNKGEGTCAAGGDASGSHFLDTPAITVPANFSVTETAFLSFDQFMQSEAGFDGGNLKVSVNGGAFTVVPTAAFTYNAHSGVFVTTDNTSPNAGQAAWTGSDQGEATGSWGTTVVDLSKLATVPTADQTVKFRFDFANDGCGGNLGWFVDDVNAFQCVANVAPVAKFRSVTPVSGGAPLVVNFDAADSSDADAGDRVASYTLDFGDGSAVVTQAGAAFSHTYQAAGSYTATLTVADSTGTLSAAVTQAIEVITQAVKAFTFLERTEVKTKTIVTSELITLSGFTGTLPISVSGPAGASVQYSINNGPFTTEPGTVKAGDKIAVRHISDAAEGKATTSTVTVGSYSTPFKTVTTTLDHVPDAFEFATQSNVTGGQEVMSNVLTLTAYDDAPITAGPGMSYRINGGAWSTARGTLVKGQTLQLKHVANTASLGYTKSTVTVGGVKGSFTTRTKK